MREGCIDPRFLDLGTSWRLVSFTSLLFYPQTKGLWYSLDRRLMKVNMTCKPYKYNSNTRIIPKNPHSSIKYLSLSKNTRIHFQEARLDICLKTSNFISDTTAYIHYNEIGTCISQRYIFQHISYTLCIRKT
jgi:hypothetical protein